MIRNQILLAKKALFKGMVRRRPKPPRDLGEKMVFQAIEGVKFLSLGYRQNFSSCA